MHPCLLIALIAATQLAPSTPGHAQNQGLIVRDGSLGDGPAGVVAPGVDSRGQVADYLIRAEAGEQVGPNLFHSFHEFGIGAGEVGTFDGPSGIQNVISRVTGPLRSEIDGTLRSTMLGASLYLLNPAGIVFGPGARLDVGGAFHAGAADVVELQGEGRFFADLSRSSVLTVAPVSDFGFLQLPGGPVTVDGAELQVPTGSDLSLAGGSLRIESESLLAAPEGRLRLRAPSGEIGIESEAGVQIGAVGALDGSSGVRVLGASVSLEMTGPEDSVGGSLSVRGRDVEISGRTTITSINRGAEDGGDLSIVADDSIQIVGTGESSEEPTRVTADTGASGRGGAVLLEAPQVQIENGALVSSSSGVRAEDPVTGVEGFIGSGDAGGVTIRAAEVEVSGGAFVQSITGTSGQGGDLFVEATDFLKLDQGSLSASTGGTGNGGSITVHAPEVVVTSGSSIASTREPLDSAAFLRGVRGGMAGDVTIRTDVLRVDDGGQISTSATFGAGTGKISITANESLSVSGRAGPPLVFDLALLRDAIEQAIRNPFDPIELDFSSLFPFTGIFSVSLLNDEAGQPVQLSVPGGSVEIRNNGVVATAAADSRFVGLPALELFVPPSTGDSGDLSIVAREIRILDGALVDSSTLSAGNGGKIELTATESIAVTGRSDDGAPSRVRSVALADGNAGAVVLNAPEVAISDGALSTSTLGLTLGALSPSAGSAGRLQVVAESLRVENGGRIDSSTFTDGDGGSIDLSASGEVLLSGRRSGVFSTAGSSGDGGEISIRGSQLVLSGGATVSAESAVRFDDRADIFADLANSGLDLPGDSPEGVASGKAGRITLQGEESIVVQGSTVRSDARDSDGGDIILLARDRIHLRDATVSANVGGGQGGSVEIDPALVLLEDSRIRARAAEEGGRGGAIRIDTALFFAFEAGEAVEPDSLSGPGRILDASAPGGAQFSGTVEVNSPDTDIAGTLTALPTAFTDPASRIQPSCASRSGAAGRFRARSCALLARRAARCIRRKGGSPLAITRNRASQPKADKLVPTPWARARARITGRLRGTALPAQEQRAAPPASEALQGVVAA